MYLCARVGGESDEPDYRTFMMRRRVEELKVQLKNKAGTEMAKDGSYE
jgi:hypothetical protein